jgi:hypothetical protein
LHSTQDRNLAPPCQGAANAAHPRPLVQPFPDFPASR